MAWKVDLMTAYGAGMSSLNQKVFRLVNGSFPPGSQSVYPLVTAADIGGIERTINSRLSLISLVCVASTAGSLGFTATDTEYSITLPLAAGLNIIKAEKSPFKHFDRGGDLIMQATTATLTGLELLFAYNNNTPGAN